MHRQKAARWYSDVPYGIVAWLVVETGRDNESTAGGIRGQQVKVVEGQSYVTSGPVAWRVSVVGMVTVFGRIRWPQWQVTMAPSARIHRTGFQGPWY